MNLTLGEHFAFTWESEITEKNGVYTSSGKNSIGATITNSWTTEADQDTPSPQWIKEKTVAVTTTDCLEENNVIWVNQTWTGTGVGGDLRFENVNQVTVNKDTIFQTLRTRPVGSEQPYGVWWTTIAKRANQTIIAGKLECLFLAALFFSAYIPDFPIGLKIKLMSSLC